MKLKPQKHSSDTLFSFLLLLIFTLFTLMLAGTGAAVYKNSTVHLNENYTSRTAIAYISEKVRQHNSAGNIFFSDVEGQESLVLREVMEDETFLTYIYYYDGALCELFVREDTVPTAQSGTRIVELSGLTFSPVESLVQSDHNSDFYYADETEADYESDSNYGSETESPLTSESIFRVTATSPEGNSLSMLIHYY